MNIERDLVEDDLPLSLVGRSYLWSSLHWILVKLFTFYRTLSFCRIDGFIGLGNMIFVINFFFLRFTETFLGVGFSLIA